MLKDACMFFEKYTQGYQTFSDGTRMCSYQICLTEDEFAGIPIQIIQVDEYYSKRKKDLQVHFFAVCTEMEMSAKEIREVAHYRWQIENNVFEKLNEHCGTKNERKKSGSGRDSAREEKQLGKTSNQSSWKTFLTAMFSLPECGY